MIARMPILILSLLFFGLPALGDDLPEVLQPNETVYSPQEVAALIQEITTLEETLSNDQLGSRRTFAPHEWQSSDFATYSAGVLTELGFETYLVNETGWPDRMHTWVLVKIDLDGTPAWVPVEAAPKADHIQETLGHIPHYTDNSGNLWFEESYLLFSDMFELPENRPPVARIRSPKRPIEPSRVALFHASPAYDPDGEIILYLWEFGDGISLASSDRYITHRFDKKGTYSIVLTVFDNKGRSSSTSKTITVARFEEEKDEDTCIPCRK